MFHKTLNGATIGELITSMIATGAQAGVNVFEYFTVLHPTSPYYSETEYEVKKHPENYLPWNYLENI